MSKKKAKYEVLNQQNEIIISGDILSEIIATTILDTFKHLESDKSLLYKIEKNYFSFYNILSGVYKNSDYFYWDNIKQIELIHNNDTFLDQSKFIKFKRNTWTLVKPVLNINLNFKHGVSWKMFKERG